MARRRVIVGGLALLLASGGLLVPVSQPEPAAAEQAPDERPNIVLVTTDDQRADDMEHMPYTRTLLGDAGVTFDRAMSPHPLCCPARAEWMTGQYGQNNGVRHNTGPHGGFGSLVDPGDNVAAWLKGAGYRTAMVGKFMNGYGAGVGAVPGWDRWNPLVARSYAYTGSTFLNDGDPVRHPEHVDDVTFDYAEQYVRDFAGAGRPFFVWASNLAPHAALRDGRWQAAYPADRHRGTLAGVTSPALDHPGYNVADGFSVRAGTDGDTGYVRRRLPRRNSTRTHQARVESLQAVDEGVRDLVETLREVGELDNTYLMFTSDNGYLLGEHRLVGKNFFYDEALEVPLLVKVPGASGPSRSRVPVTSVDLAPTIAAIAGARPGRVVDGASFLPLLHGESMPWRRHQLVQSGDTTEGGWIVRGVRTSRWAYARNVNNGREQLIKRRRDPYEMRDQSGNRRYRPVLRELRRTTRRLGRCAGASCR